MKKTILLLAVASLSLSVASQEVDDVVSPGEKHSVATNSFWSNWFLQGGAVWNAFYAPGENSLVAPFRKFPSGEGHTGWGAAVAVGKWFTPGIGLRTKLNFWQMGSKKDGVSASKYWELNEQVLLNVSNMVLGYNEKRLWNAIPFFGAGVNHRSDSHGLQASAGLLNTFRLTDRLQAHLEAAVNFWESGGGSLRLKNHERQFALEVGLTYRLGRHTWKRAADVDAIGALTEGELDALNAQLSDALSENADLQQQIDTLSAALRRQPAAPAPAPAVAVRPQVISAPVSIFFDLGKAVVVTPRDRENVAALAAVAREHNLRVIVTGYADSKTGTPEGNRRISQQRADAVADQLVQHGVSRDMISTVAMGGVSTLQTTENNRRVVVELKEK